MSKLETPLTRWYWSKVGGTLIEEFVAVEATPHCGRRVIDGVILLNGEFRIAEQSEVSLENGEVIVVQTKIGRLGMYLMGQALFSAELIRKFGPRTVRSVALCQRSDSVLQPLFEKHPGMQVIVCAEAIDG